MAYLRDTKLDKHVGKELLAKNNERDKDRKPSGKLSASMLGDPLQWQVLKWLGVPRPEIDEYVVRKFLRGTQIEEWLVSQIDGLVEKQKMVEYKEAIGYIDALVDTKDWDFKMGIIPVEIKSISNAKFRRIMEEGTPQRGHELQAGFYALAHGSPYYAVVYVAADDLRVEVFARKTEEIKDEIDWIISLFNEAIAKKIIPPFEANEVWQKSKKYNKYPDFMELGGEELKIKAKELYGNKT